MLSPYVDYTPEDDRRSTSPAIVRFDLPYHVTDLAVFNDNGQFIGTLSLRHTIVTDGFSLRASVKDADGERIAR